MISRENYEPHAVDYLEGHMEPSQRKAFEDFLTENPDIQVALRDVEWNALKPDLSITYQKKDKLLRKSTGRNWWYLAGIAASILLIVTLVWNQPAPEVQEQIARENTQTDVHKPALEGESVASTVVPAVANEQPEEKPVVASQSSQMQRDPVHELTELDPAVAIGTLVHELPQYEIDMVARSVWASDPLPALGTPELVSQYTRGIEFYTGIDFEYLVMDIDDGKRSFSELFVPEVFRRSGSQDVLEALVPTGLSLKEDEQ